MKLLLVERVKLNARSNQLIINANSCYEKDSATNSCNVK